MAKTAKLHEILAVESKLEQQMRKTVADLSNTFTGKHAHFNRVITTFTPIAEGAPAEITEKQEMQTTVPKELGWIAPFIAKSLDASYQVSVGNTLAKADILLDDGSVFLSDVPASTLLELEDRLDLIKGLVLAIPTLDPVKGFVPETGETGVYKSSQPNKRERTVKTSEPVVLYPATDKHPAQVQLVSVDRPTGSLTTEIWSGALTVNDKGAMIERVESLSRAVRQARSRANNVELDPSANKIGQAIVNHVFDLS